MGTPCTQTAVQRIVNLMPEAAALVVKTTLVSMVVGILLLDARNLIIVQPNIGLGETSHTTVMLRMLHRKLSTRFHFLCVKHKGIKPYVL